MKRFLSLALAFSMVALAGTSYATNPSDFPVGTAAGGIMGSRHNIGATGVHWRTAIISTGTSLGKTALLGTTEVCVFCHTPHHGGVQAPLWNRVMNTGGAYTVYGTATGAGSAAGVTLGGTTITSIGAASLACLSCHDGTIVFDALVNAPGYGNSGTNNGHDGTALGWIMMEDGTGTTDGKKMSSTRLNIGTDLTNDHPISITYNETDVASLRLASTTISSLNMAKVYADTGDTIDTGSIPTETATNNLWAVRGQVSDSADINDILRAGKVECSSCHDPHFSNKTWTEAENTWGGEGDSDGMFLRRIGGNALSGVCRTCHNK